VPRKYWARRSGSCALASASHATAIHFGDKNVNAGQEKHGGGQLYQLSLFSYLEQADGEGWMRTRMIGILHKGWLSGAAWASATAIAFWDSFIHTSAPKLRFASVSQRDLQRKPFVFRADIAHYGYTSPHGRVAGLRVQSHGRRPYGERHQLAVQQGTSQPEKSRREGSVLNNGLP
jgi:hypothetical protein